MHDHPLDHVPPRRLRTIAIAAACVAAAVVAVGVGSRVLASQHLAARTDSEAIPTVAVITLSNAGHGNALVLPGDVEAFYTAPVYARVTGYLRAWYTDIGAVVKSGQTLADIDTPDLDQQVVAARGSLAVAVANQNLAAITAKRYKMLFAENAISAEARDQAVATLQADIAATEAARGNLGQLVAEQAFKKIVAPFDGVVTTRATDVGALIVVGTPAATPLFTVADEHRLRIYMRVPQNSSALVRPGMTATFTVPQYPGRTFTAALATTSEAVNVQNGALLAEFQIDNADHALKPGDYAQMHLDVPTQPNALILPASALMFRDGGMSVAAVGPGNRAIIKRVTIGRDMGTTVEVAAGLARTDRIIDNPPDSLKQGDPVHIASRAAHGPAKG